MDKIKFTEEQLEQLTWEGSIWDKNEKELFKVVESNLHDYDLEKSYITNRVVILDIENNKFYIGNLMKNYYHKNNNVKWKEVFPYQETITTYK